MPPFYDEEASRAPLVASNGYDVDDVDDDTQTSRSGARTSSSSLIVNRILIIVTLVTLVAVSIVFQMEQTNLTQQLASDEATIKTLLSTVQSQGKVIDRFNQSVTNSDVLTHLTTLEKTLTASEEKLQAELDTTLHDVQQELKLTMNTLDETVTKAKAEITDQVESVKKDFAQYKVRTEDQFSMENSFMVYQLAGTFTLLSCLISMWHLTAHLRKMKQPVIQRKILAILWMSPIYAVTSWFSLVFPSAEGYLAIIKDGYEAYIIYQFLSFCIAVLGKGNRAAVVDLLARRADHLTPPFRLFFCCQADLYENDHQLADAILLQCQFFAMQFVFFRPVTTIANVVLAKYEYYGPWGAEDANDWRAPQFYVTLIQNLSIFIAFTGLLKFYHAVDEDLKWCRPFAKFLCIKGVVFMTFWQGLAITILAAATDMGGNDAEEWALSAQNFLICLEMLLFSIAHFYCFPTEEWEDGYRANFNKGQFGDSIALGDFFADLKLIMKGSKKKKKKNHPSEPTVPEGDEKNGEEEEGENPDEDDNEDDPDDTEEGEYEDDAGTAENTSVTSELTSNTDREDPKRTLAKAIGNASESDTPEVEEARNRILQSGFLNDMLFMTPTKQVSLLEGESASASQEEIPAIHSSLHSENDAMATPGVDPANERTGLLSGFGPSPPVSSSTSLRPSIFTTIAALSESDQQDQDSKKDPNS